jgi:hypothetical protein
MQKSVSQRELIKNYSNLDLKILPMDIEKNGFDYRLVVRDDRRLIYSQSLEAKIIAYEVFKNLISKYREKMIDMKKRTGRPEGAENLPEYREVFPGDEEFGKRAWVYLSLDDAQERYHSL